MFGIGMMELTVILVIALLVFGPKKLPEIGKGLGQGIREFKKAGQEFAQSLDQEASKTEALEDKSKKDDETPKA